jgi:hypothetical protein
MRTALSGETLNIFAEQAILQSLHDQQRTRIFERNVMRSGASPLVTIKLPDRKVSLTRLTKRRTGEINHLASGHFGRFDGHDRRVVEHLTRSRHSPSCGTRNISGLPPWGSRCISDDTDVYHIVDRRIRSEFVGVSRYHSSLWDRPLWSLRLLIVNAREDWFRYTSSAIIGMAIMRCLAFLLLS